MEKTSLNQKKVIRGLVISLTIGIAVFLIVFLLTLDKNTMKSFQHMDEGFLLLAVVAVFLSVMVEGLRIQVLAHAIDEKIGFWESVKIFYISFFLGGITPYFSGAIPGQIFLFTQKGICVGKSMMIATIRPIIKSIIFLILTPILFFYFSEPLEEYEILSWLLLFAAMLFSLIFIFIFVLAVKNPQKLKSIIEWFKRISFFKNYLDRPNVQQKLEGLMSQAIQFNNSYHLMLNHRKEIILAFFYTVVYWFLYFSIAPLLLLALEIELDYALVMIIQILIFFLLPFLPTPGGSGVAELGFASLFSFFVPSHLLGIYVGGWRLFTFYLYVLIGALLSLGVLRKWITREKDLKSNNC